MAAYFAAMVAVAAGMRVCALDAAAAWLRIEPARLHPPNASGHRPIS
jgi:hypothetical protein